MTIGFAVQIDQQKYLPVGARRLDAVVSVTAEGAMERSERGALGAEVVVIDVSGSMDGPKLLQAKAATVAAIDRLSSGVRFAVVGGNERATQVYPTAGMVPANRRTRAEAARAVRKLKAEGGTAMGEWVSMVARLQAPVVGVRHAILLTDGKDEHETPQALDSALAAARGVFQCDCRGVGTDWSVPELRRIADALLGSVDIVAKPAGLTQDFEGLVMDSMDKGVADVRLRVRTPHGAAPPVTVKQVVPTITDLAAGAVRVDDHTLDYPLGSWAAEGRDYHLGFDVEPGRTGDSRVVAEVALLVAGRMAATGRVQACWTDNTELSTKVNPRVELSIARQSLARAVQDGLAARRAGDEPTALTHLGQAARLAFATGNRDAADLLQAVVEVEDWPTGRVRPRSEVRLEDEMTLDSRSTRTVRVGR